MTERGKKIGHTDTPIVRVPLSVRLLSLAAVIVLIASAGFVILVAVVAIRSSVLLGVVVAVCAALMVALVAYVLRDLQGKLGLRITLQDDAVTLDLPRGRSLIHRPPAQHLTVPYSDITAVEARDEGYESLGMAMIQRVYALRRKNDELIFLFEDRALATPLSSSFFAGTVADLIERANVPLRDLGTVLGNGGLLCTWGTQAPDWATPPLPIDQVQRLWAKAAATGSMALRLSLFLSTTRGNANR